MDGASLGRRLGLGDACQKWLAELQAAGVPEPPLRAPAREEVLAVLGRLGVEALDAGEVADTLPSPEAQPEWWWLLERSCAWMRRHMGECGTELTWPVLPAELGSQGRLFLAHLLVLVFADVRRWHRAHGVPDAVSWETLSALGRAMAIHRQREGVGGVFEHGWMTLPFRACLYELGRLQYTPFRLSEGRVGACFGSSPLREGFRPGDPAVGIHIPAAGPLSAEGVDRSLLQARDLFARPSPWGPCRVAVCGSWLLDEQLGEYLPPTANIVRFQRRFVMCSGAGDGDGSVFNFVFHRRGAPASLDDLPQRTTLERAVVEHLRQGRHWQTRTGWLEL